MAEKQYTYEAVQARLRTQKSKARLYLRDGYIWVQGTFPPKPGSTRAKPYQQKFSLNLVANKDGFKKAEKKAIAISGLLQADAFDWNEYLSSDKIPETKPARLWIGEFAEHYQATHDIKCHTWNKQWMEVFNQLPQDKPVTPEILKAIALRTKDNTRNRKEKCLKLQHLADFVGLDVNLTQYKGSYGASKVKHRELPKDYEVANLYYQIPNPAWRWMYGVIAAYGLRPHEAFFAEWTDQGLYVTKGKTGPRLVFQALFPQWAEDWNLSEVIKPNIDAEAILEKYGGCFEKLGSKVTKQLKRYGLPYTAYDFRHAYAIRASVTFDLKPGPASALMGHSPNIHYGEYHKHARLADHQAAVARIVNSPDCPKPPSAEMDPQGGAS
jgi:integrase